MLEFEKVAPYLSDPLILIGFFLFLFFSFSRYLLKRGIIPPLGKAHGYRALRLILLYGFLFGLAIIGLGFGLKYRSLAEVEQRKAVALLKSEMETNAALVAQMAANLEKLVSGHEVVARALRDARFPILATLFPESNLRRELSNPTPHDIATSSLQRLRESGLSNDKRALQKTAAVGKAIVAMIERTLPTMESLGDAQRRRYILRRTAYEGNVDVLRRIEYLDLTHLPEIYADLEKVRANYEVVVANLIGYLQAVRAFFLREAIDERSLTDVLTAERLATSMLLAYTPELVEAGQSLQQEMQTLFTSARTTVAGPAPNSFLTLMSQLQPTPDAGGSD